MAAEGDGPRLERLKAANRLFERLLDEPTEERFAVLDAECKNDEALRGEVETLLRLHQDADDFLEQPAAEKLPLEPELPRFQAGHRIGNYTIAGVLGEGGGGIVYEATQANPRRTVALKFLRAGLGSTGATRRFEEEAQILARLDHPDVAYVYEAGTFQDRDRTHPWFALEHVTQGKTLRRYVQDHELGARRCAALIARVCRAIHHGHQKGIIHCDLKPQNILVRPDGQPKVIDFGVAHFGAGKRKSVVAGTPGYMSPEQMDGEFDLRADVFALGTILDRILPKQRDKDLRAVVAKAKADDVEQRYESAQALAADLEHYLKREPVDARPVGVLHHVDLFARRRTALFVAILAVAVAVAAGVAFSLNFALSADKARRETERARQDERFRAYVANVAAASAALRVMDISSAAHHLESAPAELRNWEWRYLAGQLDLSERTLGESFLHGYTWLALSTDQRLLLMCQSAQETSLLTMFDTDTWEPVHLPAIIPGMVHAPAFLADDTLVWYERGWIVARDPENFALVWSRRAPDEGTKSLHPVAGGDLVVWQWAYGQASVLDAGNGKQLGIFGERDESIQWTASAVDPEGRRLALSREEEIGIWDLETAQLVGELPDSPAPVACLAYSADGEMLAIGENDGGIRVRDVLTGRELLAVRAASRVTKTAFGPEGTWLVAGHANGTLTVWDLASRRLLATLWGHRSPVVDVIVLPDGRIVSSEQGQAKVWRHDALRRAIPFPQLVRGVAFHPDGTQIACASFDAHARIYDIDQEEFVAEIVSETDNERCQDVAFHPSGDPVAVAWQNGIEIWSVASGERRWLPERDEGTFTAFWSPDGSHLAACGTEGSLLLWDGTTYEFLRVLKHSGIVRNAAFTPDGKRLVSASRDGEVTSFAAWDVASGQRLWSVETNANPPCLAMHPDGRRVATGAKREAHLRDLEDGGILRTYAGMPTNISALAFNPSGDRLAATTTAPSIRLWDVESGAAVLNLIGHEGWVWALDWSPDGSRLATGAGTYDRAGSELRIWEGR